MALRVGVVGLGFMGSRHLQAYEKVAESRVVAVVSSDERKLAGDLADVGGNLPGADRRMDFSNLSRYRRFEELLSDPAVEAVDICVPTFLHFPLAVQALESGKHVLVEKPMALSADECEEMIKAAARSGRVLMVAHLLRFWPAFSEARRQILSGKLGNVIQAGFRRKCGAPVWSNWLQDPTKSGGGAFDLLIHDFDYCSYLFGKPESVAAEGVEDLARGIDLVEARLHFAGGLTAFVSGGWYPGPYGFSAGFSLALEDASLDYESNRRELTLFPRAGQPQTLASDDDDAFEIEVRAFAEACRKSETPAVCSPESSALSVDIALAVLESRRQGGNPVAL